jgi:hypothetical protein
MMRVQCQNAWRERGVLVLGCRLALLVLTIALLSLTMTLVTSVHRVPAGTSLCYIPPDPRPWAPQLTSLQKYQALSHREQRVTSQMPQGYKRFFFDAPPELLQSIGLHGYVHRDLPVPRTQALKPFTRHPPERLYTTMYFRKGGVEMTSRSTPSPKHTQSLTTSAAAPRSTTRSSLRLTRCHPTRPSHTTCIKSSPTHEDRFKTAIIMMRPLQTAPPATLEC